MTYTSTELSAFRRSMLPATARS